MGSKVLIGEKEVEQLVFRCTTCNFVLKQEKGESPPSYCPNCAIQHLGGEMVLEPGHATDERREEAPDKSRESAGNKRKFS